MPAMPPVQMPTVEIPEALERVADAAREREQELRDAEAALQAAEQDVGAARERDVEAVAAAREAGEADPPARHEQAAQLELEEAGRERDVRAARARIADERLQELLAEQAPAWQQRVEAEWGEIDAALRRKLAEVEAALGRRVELSAARAWLRAVQRGENRERALRKASAPAAQIGMPDLRELRAAVDAGSVEAVSGADERAWRQHREAAERGRVELERGVASARQAQAQERERLGG